MRISNAKDGKVEDQSNALPDVSAGVMEFFQPIKVEMIEKEQVAGYTEESAERCFSTLGVRQPFSAQRLQIKTEGERHWKWSTLWCLPDLKLIVDDRIRIRKVEYRVMAKTDYGEYGYSEYELIEDYRHAES